MLCAGASSVPDSLLYLCCLFYVVFTFHISEQRNNWWHLFLSCKTEPDVVTQSYSDVTVKVHDLCVRGEREMCGIVQRIVAELVYLLNVSVAEVGWSLTGYRVKLNQPWQPRYFESQASHMSRDEHIIPLRN